MTDRHWRAWWVAMVGCLALQAPLAWAASAPLAQLTADTPISAQQGWVVWSARAASGGWVLVGAHDGVVSVMAVPPNRSPFDVSLGTDARGAAVATYSRCTGTPTAIFDGGVDDWQGQGCRVYVLELATGREQLVAIPHPAAASDTFPSMWRGAVAFARYDPRHGDVDQIELWRPGAAHLQTLPHGALPAQCQSCQGMHRIGAVQGLSYDGQIVSFRWAASAPGVIGFLGWELRVDRVSSASSLLAGAGWNGEVCAGGPDSIVPSAPSTTGTTAFFDTITTYCYVTKTSQIRSFNATSDRGHLGDLTGLGAATVLELTRDSATGAWYALIAPAQSEESPPTCANPGAPCTLTQLQPPPLASPFPQSVSPFS